MRPAVYVPSFEGGIPVNTRQNDWTTAEAVWYLSVKNNSTIIIMSLLSSVLFVDVFPYLSQNSLLHIESPHPSPLYKLTTPSEMLLCTHTATAK